MNIELFDKAVEFIASLDDEQLNLEDWQHVDYGGKVAHSSKDVVCGTIACAAGWLALNPEFEAYGLSTGIMGTPRLGDRNAGYRAEYRVGYHAMSKLLDLPTRIAMKLFFYKNSQDRVLFDIHLERMTDRQLWLSRARLVRGGYVWR